MFIAYLSPFLFLFGLYMAYTSVPKLGCTLGLTQCLPSVASSSDDQPPSISPAPVKSQSALPNTPPPSVSRLVGFSYPGVLYVVQNKRTIKQDAIFDTVPGSCAIRIQMTVVYCGEDLPPGRLGVHGGEGGERDQGFARTRRPPPPEQ